MFIYLLVLKHLRRKLEILGDQFGWESGKVTSKLTTFTNITTSKWLLIIAVNWEIKLVMILLRDDIIFSHHFLLELSDRDVRTNTSDYRSTILHDSSCSKNQNQISGLNLHFITKCLFLSSELRVIVFSMYVVNQLLFKL